jgi:DNA-binding PucR family transcriptional regulator
MQENESIEIKVRQKRRSSEQITELVREFRSSGLNATEVLRTARRRGLGSHLNFQQYFNLFYSTCAIVGKQLPAINSTIAYVIPTVLYSDAQGTTH